MINTIRFQRVQDITLGAPRAVIQVDGREFIDLVREAEAPEATATGQPELAGRYAYVDLPRIGDPTALFQGKPDPLFAGAEGRVVLLACDSCGEPGCWPLEARITMGADAVTWQDFRQPHRPTWSYSHLGPFVFERRQYEAALATLARR